MNQNRPRSNSIARTQQEHAALERRIFKSETEAEQAARGYYTENPHDQAPLHLTVREIVMMEKQVIFVQVAGNVRRTMSASRATIGNDYTVNLTDKQAEFIETLATALDSSGSEVIKALALSNIAASDHEPHRFFEVLAEQLAGPAEALRNPGWRTRDWLKRRERLRLSFNSAKSALAG